MNKNKPKGTILEQGITGRQSALLQGVAILLMIYHHYCLYIGSYRSLLMSAESATRLAWFGKICVALFSFVSGYGMYYVMQKKRRSTLLETLRSEYGGVLARILRVYRKLWLVLALFLLIRCAVLGQPFVAEELAGNLTALDPTYNGAWWYVEQYAKMLLVLPLLDLCCSRLEKPAEERKKRRLIIGLAVLGVAAALVGLFIWPPLGSLLYTAAKSMRISFLASFIVGYLCARYGLYQRVAVLLQRAGYGLPVVIAAVMLAGVVSLRILLATDASYAETDFVMTPLFVYGLLILLHFCPHISSVLVWLGHESAYMWLEHIFFFDAAVRWIRPAVGLDAIVYVLIVLVSAAAAVGLNGITQLIKMLVTKINVNKE